MKKSLETKFGQKGTKIRPEISFFAIFSSWVKVWIIVNSEHIKSCSIVSIVNFEQVNAGWVVITIIF